jgi:hypothetical protein
VKAERITPVAVTPPDEIVVTLTLKEVKAIREALYIAYLARDTQFPGSCPFVPMAEVTETGNELYNKLTRA